MDTVSFVKRHLLSRSFISYILYPISLLYALLMKLRRRYLYLRPYHSRLCIISIGNITAGGSGKTPITIALANSLKAKGLQVVVAHRGYKGGLEKTATMISNKDSLLFSAAIAGDEAVMIATALPHTPVYVGKKRREVLKQIEKDFPATDVVILDDAFQHLAVARNLDIVVVDNIIGLGNGFCLPAGYLREEISAITPETMVLIHNKPGAPVANDRLIQRLRQRTARLHSVFSHANLITLKGSSFDIELFKGKTLNLLSAIGNPQALELSLKQLKVSWNKHFAFADHYAYDDAEAIKEAFQADYVLCTAKDYVKLKRYSEYSAKLLVLHLQCRLEDDVVESICRRIGDSDEEHCELFSMRH